MGGGRRLQRHAALGGQSAVQFDFTTTAYAATSAGQNPPTGVSIASQNQTPPTGIVNGSVLGVKSGAVNDLSIGLAPESAYRVTATQAGLVNNTCGLLIDVYWQINGNPVVMVPSVNQGQIVTFEFEPTIYIMAASPTQQGRVGSFNFTVQEVSTLTSYTIPPGAGNVTVSWSRSSNSMGGTDIFSFNPPSYQL